MMELFNNRKTYRAFKSNALPDDHTNSIVSAGCSAPSKQRIYPYRIIALTQSEASIAIKNRLFYESFINELKNKHLLTAKAPLLLVWVGIYLPDNGDLNLSSNQTDMRSIAKTWNFQTASAETLSIVRARADKDAAISASFSMIQAEALGYSTAFNDCYIKEKAVEILGLAENEWPTMFLAVGKPELVLTRKSVFKDGTCIGFSDPRSFEEPPKLSLDDLVQII
jgi:nitroreductase